MSAPRSDPAGRVTARRATVEDASTLAELRWRWGTERGPRPPGDRTAFVGHFTTWVVAHLDTHLPFVVTIDGRTCGMAWLMLADRVPSPHLPDRRTGDVQAVYVEPALRNAGVGAALIEAVLAEARRQGLEHVTVHSSAGAVTFYRRAGFQDGQNWLQYRP